MGLFLFYALAPLLLLLLLFVPFSLSPFWVGFRIGIGKDKGRVEVERYETPRMGIKSKSKLGC